MVASGEIIICFGRLRERRGKPGIIIAVRHQKSSREIAIRKVRDDRRVLLIA